MEAACRRVVVAVGLALHSRLAGNFHYVEFLELEALWKNRDKSRRSCRRTVLNELDGWTFRRQSQVDECIELALRVARSLWTRSVLEGFLSHRLAGSLSPPVQVFVVLAIDQRLIS